MTKLGRLHQERAWRAADSMTDAIAPPKCHNKSKGRTLSDEEAKVEQINDAFLADIEANNVSNIKKALDEGQNPNVGTESGESSVHLAMRAPTTDILKALIAKDAHLEFQDDYDKRPIEIGIEGGANQVEHIKVLLKQKVIKDGVEVLAVDLRKRNAKKGTNLLHTAAWVGNLEATKVLLETGEFDDILEDTNIQGQTALHLAAFRAPTELCARAFKYPSLKPPVQIFYALLEPSARLGTMHNRSKAG